MTDRQAKFEQIAAQVATWRAELNVPGVTYGVHIGGEVYSGGCGVTSVENPLPVTDETIFQIGSITKTVTATLIMRLAEQGALALDARVREYLPGFRVSDESVAERVTLRHLLTHRAGWTGDVFTDTGNNDDALAQYVARMEDFEQLAPLSAYFSYNNAAFAVAGRVIEALTGMSYEDAVRELIFEPLGLERSYFFPHEVMLRRFAVGHQLNRGEPKVLSPWAIPRGLNAGGGIACHIQDLLRYGAYHLGDGSPLMNADNFAEMHRPQGLAPPAIGHCGLAWMISDYDGKAAHWHTGGTNGQDTLLVVMPQLGLALGSIANGDKGLDLNNRFRKAVLKTFADIDLQQQQAIASRAAELAEYVGKYQGTMRAIELKLQEGRLFADIRFRGGLPSDRELPPTPLAELARCGPDELLVLDGFFKGTRADVVRNAAGAIRYLRFGSRLNRKLD